MDFKFLLYSFLFAVAAFTSYKLHKRWVNIIRKKSEAFYKPDIKLDIFKHWLIIIGLAIASIVYFFKAIG
jgi:hypothetical protein